MACACGKSECVCGQERPEGARRGYLTQQEAAALRAARGLPATARPQVGPPPQPGKLLVSVLADRALTAEVWRESETAAHLPGGRGAHLVAALTAFCGYAVPDNPLPPVLAALLQVAGWSVVPAHQTPQAGWVHVSAAPGLEVGFVAKVQALSEGRPEWFLSLDGEGEGKPRRRPLAGIAYWLRPPGG